MIKFDQEEISTEEQAYGSTWLITYSDMVTIILCFFIIFFMMNAEELSVLSHLNEEMEEEVQEMASEVEEKASTVEHLSDENLQLAEENEGLAEENVGLAEENVGLAKENAGLTESLESLQLALEEARAGEDASMSFIQYLQDKDIMDSVEIIENERGLAIRFSDRVLFDSGEAALNAEGLLLLEEMAEILKDLENHIIIEGHTDNIPTDPARYPSNWELSLDRSMGVARYFIDEKEFSEHQISVSGYGETRPLAPNDEPEGRAKNRRIEIVILQ